MFKEMALNIVLNAHNVTSDKDCDLHLMPCKINHDGPANVKEFFVPNVHQRDLQKSDTSDLLDASFRGYPLQGIRIGIPSGYRGIVLNEIKKPLTDVEERKLQSVKNFSKLTYWNWDDNPSSENSSIHQLLDWMLLSKTIHGKD